MVQSNELRNEILNRRVHRPSLVIKKYSFSSVADELETIIQDNTLRKRLSSDERFQENFFDIYNYLFLAIYRSIRESKDASSPKQPSISLSLFSKENTELLMDI